jgi:hypothetical protein
VLFLKSSRRPPVLDVALVWAVTCQAGGERGIRWWWWFLFRIFFPFLLPNTRRSHRQMIWLFVCPSVTHSISILLPSLSDWSPSSGLTSGPADPFDEIRFSIVSHYRMHYRTVWISRRCIRLARGSTPKWNSLWACFCICLDGKGEIFGKPFFFVLFKKEIRNLSICSRCRLKEDQITKWIQGELIV